MWRFYTGVSAMSRIWCSLRGWQGRCVGPLPPTSWCEPRAAIRLGDSRAESRHPTAAAPLSPRLYSIERPNTHRAFALRPDGELHRAGPVRRSPLRHGLCISSSAPLPRHTAGHRSPNASQQRFRVTDGSRGFHAPRIGSPRLPAATLDRAPAPSFLDAVRVVVAGGRARAGRRPGGGGRCSICRILQALDVRRRCDTPRRDACSRVMGVPGVYLCLDAWTRSKLGCTKMRCTRSYAHAARCAFRRPKCTFGRAIRSLCSKRKVVRARAREIHFFQGNKVYSPVGWLTVTARALSTHVAARTRPCHRREFRGTRRRHRLSSTIRCTHRRENSFAPPA